MSQVSTQKYTLGGELFKSRDPARNLYCTQDPSNKCFRFIGSISLRATTDELKSVRYIGTVRRLIVMPLNDVTP